MGTDNRLRIKSIRNVIVKFFIFFRMERCFLSSMMFSDLTMGESSLALRFVVVMGGVDVIDHVGGMLSMFLMTL